MIIGGAIVLSQGKDSGNQPAPASSNSSSSSSTSPSSAIPVSDTARKAKYIEYSDTAISSNPGMKVLFFHAAWCKQCRMIEDDILKGPLPDNWTIIKVDYDSHQDLRKKYGVTLQTTFVKVDDQGNATDDKFVAYDDPSLKSVTNVYLNSK